jgi:hypothetical protein
MMDNVMADTISRTEPIHINDKDNIVIGNTNLIPIKTPKITT